MSLWGTWPLSADPKKHCVQLKLTPPGEPLGTDAAGRSGTQRDAADAADAAVGRSRTDKVDAVGRG